jgi:hypothetical protein
MTCTRQSSRRALAKREDGAEGAVVIGLIESAVRGVRIGEPSPVVFVLTGRADVPAAGCDGPSVVDAHDRGCRISAHGPGQWTRMRPTFRGWVCRRRNRAAGAAIAIAQACHSLPQIWHFCSPALPARTTAHATGAHHSARGEDRTRPAGPQGVRWGQRRTGVGSSGRRMGYSTDPHFVAPRRRSCFALSRPPRIAALVLNVHRPASVRLRRRVASPSRAGYGVLFP